MRTLLLLSVLLAAAAHAQPAVAVGDEVRVERRPDGRLVGMALAVGADSIVVADPVTGEPVPVFFGDVRSLEVRRTRSRSRDMLKGTLIGAGVGAVPLVVLGTMGLTSSGEGRWALLGAFTVAPLVVVGAGVGAAVTGIGRTDWWERVPTGYISAQPFAVGEGGGGVRLVVRL